MSPALSCDSPLDQKIKGNMIADLLTLAGIVPLEKRSKVEARKQGLHYGAYLETQEKPKTRSNKSKSRKSNGTSQSPFNLDFTSNATKIINRPLTKDEKEILRETDEEYKLRGHFRRIFPNGNYCLYRNFFWEERPLNILIDNKIWMRRWNNK